MPIKCYLCSGDAFEEEFCDGCNEYVCSIHPNEPIGEHEPQAHDDMCEEDD